MIEERWAGMIEERWAGMIEERRASMIEAIEMPWLKRGELAYNNWREASWHGRIERNSYEKS